MDTMSVRGFWCVEQLERVGLTTTRLTLAVMVTSVVVFYLLFAFFLAGLPDPSTTVVAVFLGAFNGLLLSATVALARWTQADLEGLIRVAPEIEPSLGLLRPSRGLLLWCLAFEVIAWVLLFHIGRFGFTQVTPTTVLQFWTTLRGLFLGILLPVTLATTCTLALVVVIRQVGALTHAARKITIDVLALDRYPRLAAPLTRFVVLALLFVSFAPTLGFLDNSGRGKAITALGMPILIVGVIVLMATYAYPVWILRGRIRAAKLRELDCVFDSLRGVEGAMARSRIGARGQSLGFSELMDYRSFIESLWDWPVAPHLQRVLLVGLLPPTTWALAALIENAVSAFLGPG